MSARGKKARWRFVRCPMKQHCALERRKLKGAGRTSRMTPAHVGCTPALRRRAAPFLHIGVRCALEVECRASDGALHEFREGLVRGNGYDAYCSGVHVEFDNPLPPLPTQVFEPSFHQLILLSRKSSLWNAERKAILPPPTHQHPAPGVARANSFSHLLCGCCSTLRERLEGCARIEPTGARSSDRSATRRRPSCLDAVATWMPKVCAQHALVIFSPTGVHVRHARCRLQGHSLCLCLPLTCHDTFFTQGS